MSARGQAVMQKEKPSGVRPWHQEGPYGNGLANIRDANGKLVAGCVSLADADLIISAANNFVSINEREAEIARLKGELANKERETIERCAALAEAEPDVIARSIWHGTKDSIAKAIRALTDHASETKS